MKPSTRSTPAPGCGSDPAEIVAPGGPERVAVPPDLLGLLAGASELEIVSELSAAGLLDRPALLGLPDGREVEVEPAARRCTVWIDGTAVHVLLRGRD